MEILNRQAAFKRQKKKDKSFSSERLQYDKTKHLLLFLSNETKTLGI